MDRLKAQENQSEIRKLRQLLQSTPRETKQEREWKLLENALFVQLDEVAIPANRKKESLLFRNIQRILPQRITAIGYAVSLIILLVIGIFFWESVNTPDNLKYSRILGLKGEVSFDQNRYSKFDNSKVTITDKDKQPALYTNQVFETGRKATLIVQIDKKSHFILSEMSKLTVRNANMKNIVFFLHKGEILCSVSKRKKKQEFKVLTPNTISKVIGTVFKISTFAQGSDKRTTDLFVMEGEVKISNYEEYLGNDIVKSGQTISISNRDFSMVQGIGQGQIPIHSISLIKLLADHDNTELRPAGILDISSEPLGAEVFIKGKIVGKTPLLIKYPAGTYTLKVKMHGFEMWSGRTTIKDSRISFVNARLTGNNIISTASDEKESTKSGELMKQVRANKCEKQIKSPQSKNDDDAVLNPTFVEALVQITIGEFDKALIILDSLKELPEISMSEKICILNKISECYKGMGNFDAILETLTDKYNKEKNNTLKGALLWEIIIVKANCLGDYTRAELDLHNYIRLFPDGNWIESAYSKLGEIQYMSEKFSQAINTYKQHINRYQSGSLVENSIYLVAIIHRMDLKDYKAAIKWYTKLIENYPSSTYLGNAIFERAECYKKGKQYKKARKDYKKYLELYPNGHLRSLCLTSLSSQE
jgi:tetratricopeptide (TPR) repeat protein